MAGMFGGFQLPQMDTSVGAPIVAQPAPAQPKKKGGMFGSGLGFGEAIVHALNGYLAARGNPAGMANMQMMNQRRQQAMEQEQHGQRREDEFQDYIRKEAWKQANPGAPNNDTVADYNFRVQTLGKDSADEWLRNPPQFMNVPGVGLVQVPRMGGAQMTPPSAPVGRLTPIDEGGPVPGGPGGFPRPR